MTLLLAFTSPTTLPRAGTNPHRTSHANLAPICQLTPTASIPSSQPPSSHTLSRRQVLRTAAQVGITSLASLVYPGVATALSKKRILAKAGPAVELPSGVIYRDITVGKGYSPRNGDSVAIHYSLFYDDLEVESSRESQGLAASPIGFTFGTKAGPGSIIPGINIGVDGMKVGGLRLLTVPPDLAFGDKGKLPLIPGNATVDFAVSLLSCKRQGTNPNSIIDPNSQAF